MGIQSQTILQVENVCLISDDITSLCTVKNENLMEIKTIQTATRWRHFINKFNASDESLKLHDERSMQKNNNDATKFLIVCYTASFPVI
jgi:hypothetical protein